MNYHFSDKMNHLAPSAIREILKATSQPGIIPFAAGNPAPEAFPVDAVQKISANLLHNRPVDCLQYGITEGYAPLRERVKADVRMRLELGHEADELIITSGAMQVIDLATKVLCNEGDTILCETPSFIGSLNTFRSYGVRLCGIPMQHDGMDMDALEHALQTEKNVRFIYTIPNYQNPTGITMSITKRRHMLELARQHNVLVLEDNPYGELCYDGESPPCIKHFDDDGHVIYAGSFSKILSPGMRVGYALAPQPIIAKMTVGKQASDVHTTMWAQLVVDEWLQHYSVAEHVRNICSIYAAKRDIMCNGLAGTALQFQVPAGGLFLWCNLPPTINMVDFTQRALAQKVAVVPGHAFAVQPNDNMNAVRLNFSTPTNEQLMDGINILQRLI